MLVRHIEAAVATIWWIVRHCIGRSHLGWHKDVSCRLEGLSLARVRHEVERSLCSSRRRPELVHGKVDRGLVGLRLMHGHALVGAHLLNANLLVVLSARRQQSVAPGRDSTAAGAIFLAEGEDLLRQLRVVVV